jgi:phosphopantothenate synthetase
MKSYIIILLITLISCSKFIQKQKRIRDINLKSQYSIIQEEINKIINIFLISLPETIKSFIYVAENANFDKIVSDFKELNKNADNFLKVNPFDKLVEREKKIQNQLETIRYNSHAIMNYIKENKFPDDLAKKIKQMIDGQTQPIFSANLLLLRLKNAKKELFDNQKYEKILNDLKQHTKELPNYIKLLGQIIIQVRIIDYITRLSRIFDDAMPEIIKYLKETFPKIQAIFHNKKKIEELKQKLKTFFIFKKLLLQLKILIL